MTVSYREAISVWIWHLVPFTLPILVVLLLLFG
jgi:hypothetical protein